MRVGDIVKLVWLDSGLHVTDATLEEALKEELVSVTVYGRVAFLDERRVILEQETGRGDVGTYGVIGRNAVQEVTVLQPRPERRRPAPETTVIPLGSVSGWGGESSAPFDTQELAALKPCGRCLQCVRGWEELCSG